MSEAGVSDGGRGEEVRLEQGFLWMWALFPLAVLMGVLFVPAGEVLGGEWIVGFWGGSRTEFGQGLPCLEIIFLIGNIAG